MTHPLRHLYAHPRLPLWWRVVLFSIDHDQMPLMTGQLRDAVDPEHLTRSAEISRAIKWAIAARMLEPTSSASMLRFVHAPSDEEAA